MDTSTLLIIVSIGWLALLGGIVYLWIEMHKREEKLAILFAGKNAKSLETTLLEQIRHSKKMSQEIQELYDICEKIHKIASLGLYHVGVIRFNPFRDVGGDQSFAVALLDSQKNGVVFSSLFGKTGVRVYAKPVKKGKGHPKYQLTQEEQEAIRIASPLKTVSEFRGE